MSFLPHYFARYLSWLRQHLTFQDFKLSEHQGQSRGSSSTVLCPLSWESDCDLCCRGGGFAKTGHLSKLLIPELLHTLRGCLDYTMRFSLAKTMPHQQLHQGIIAISCLAQRDLYARRRSSCTTWACALFAYNVFLWRFTGMGNSQHVSGCWANSADEFVTEEAVSSPT